MKIAIGCDHGGIALKEVILPLLSELGHEVNDQGTNSTLSVDYPHYAKAVCDLVADNTCDCGILICGTGLGMSMAANRNKKIRAALCTEMFSARMSREHNNANVLCLGARVTGPGLAEEIVRTWLTTDFAGDRHLRRIEMF
ncbi:MAG: ribose 5-phosphate isomerase B [Proteobacteria bacterium]|nr:ribose 5-phosphate isomerase B [Pseudomonadota bacterium]MBU4297520.1 ribose 5-phosphate isomerase B [Pseudomonadota bacterium]MCG2749738.1 ribose 5-phosphate isomerase B [Desulfobulbaceae bacterium]